ncbi:hypothetical protein [Rhizobium oryzicola]|uniref:Uncharacterized protein n=1 Tax=Rhizobium oryzicola TaxID=1232668 RepID=A0ABT8SXM0_9HYPH|nr:hypothetical protein [Rhizobium oryzicola]MDO1583199.1 hypothetical protein [Rhizobium oryzicola]
MTKLLQIGHPDIRVRVGYSDERPSKRNDHHATATSGRVGGAFEGRNISGGPAQPAHTSFSFGSFIKDNAIVQAAVSKLQNFAARHDKDGLASMLGLLKTGALENAQLQQSTLRDDLSAHDSEKSNILDVAIDVKGRGQVEVSALMEELRVSLGGDKKISQFEMNRYIRMGERICEAVKNSKDGKTDVGVTVNGKTISIPSNVDTTRAVGWYMFAKAMVDNAGAEREAVTAGGDGAMLVKDPGKKLYNFLSSAPSCYGRTSTHLKAHSQNAGKKMSFGEARAQTGIISAFSVKGGGAVQSGIEDYSSKMPGGGTLLFDTIKPDSSGDSLLFMKFEPVGTPSSFSHIGRHVDPADGFARNVAGLASVAGRNIKHGFHLVESIAAKHFKQEEAYRGEKFDKGPTKAVYREFKQALENADWIDAGSKSEIAKHVATYGAAGMLAQCEEINNAALVAAVPDNDRLVFLDVSERLTKLMASLGAELGIERRGNEVHVLY